MKTMDPGLEASGQESSRVQELVNLLRRKDEELRRERQKRKLIEQEKDERQQLLQNKNMEINQARQRMDVLRQAISNRDGGQSDVLVQELQLQLEHEKNLHAQDVERLVAKEGKVAEQDQDIYDLRTQSEDLHDKLNTQFRTNSQYAKELRELRNANATQKLQLAEATNGNNMQLLNNEAELTNQIFELKNALEDRDVENASVQQALQREQHEREDALQQLERFTEDNKALSANNQQAAILEQALQQKEDHVGALQHALHQKAQIIQKLEVAIQDASKESITRMELQLNELKSRAHRVSELEVALRAKTEIITNLETVILKQSRENQELVQECRDLTAKCTKTEDALNDIAGVQGGGQGVEGLLAQIEAGMGQPAGNDERSREAEKQVKKQRAIMKRQKAELRSLSEQLDALSRDSGHAKRDQSRSAHQLKDQKLRNHALMATIKTLEDKLVSQDAENSMETRALMSEVKGLGNEVTAALQTQQITTNQKIDDLETENKALQSELAQLNSPRNQNSIVNLERKLYESEAQADLIRNALEGEREKNNRLAQESQDLQWKYLMIKSKLEASRASDNNLTRRNSAFSAAARNSRRPSGVAGNQAQPLMDDLQSDLTRDVKEYQQKTNEFCQQALDAVRAEISKLRPGDPRS